MREARVQGTVPTLNHSVVGGMVTKGVSSVNSQYFYMFL